MKFLVVAYGTEGDTRPLAALCRALIDAGHESKLLADRNTLSFAGQLRVPATPLSGDIVQSLQAEFANLGVHAGANAFRKIALAISRIANANTADWLKEIIEHGTGCDALIVSGLAAFAGLSAAEYLNVKAIGAGLMPITPTRQFASPFFRPALVPAFLNSLSHHAVNQILWKNFKQSLNAARQDNCGLPPRKRLWTDHTMLYGVSPSLVARPDDWPRNAQICGHWHWPSRDWTPPHQLVDFIEQGDAPIYVGFGSMAGFDARKLLDAIISGVNGRRAIYNPGWSGFIPSTLPSNFYPMGDAPHEWLFPRCQIVIHHAGAGTTHAASMAGVPSIVVPFAGDQFFWADRLRRVGVTGAPINAIAPRAHAVLQAITFAQSQDVRAKARELGARMTTENGLDKAVKLIEAEVTMQN
ncbi:glycosyltransferase [Paraburkholderia aromaticivorans]|uniref:glycosyltransferase n=1 Tax=Paraburkholderia aromaticivorans TaxID=2026199 RepID=UPI0014562442|nr:glycosyltransferase [Paraburkholderia aromaticivorans]